jgi:hypothetical protein
MQTLGWVLLIGGILLATGLLGPILGVIFAILALPLALVFGAIALPVVIVVGVLGLVLGLIGTVVGGVFSVLGFLLHWAVPIAVIVLGIWLLTRSRPVQRRIP